MNGVHDMGGLQCFGDIINDADSAVFHHDWEQRIFAMTLAMGVHGKWNIDSMRSARESLPPALYLSSSYYQIWLEALERMITKTGLVSAEELREGRMNKPTFSAKPLSASDVGPMLAKGAPSERPTKLEPRFKLGDAVRTKMLNPRGHTRLPRYCRDRPGVVAMVHGVHVMPDENAEGRGEHPTWLYSIRFDAKDLWGQETTASWVHADCWETYLLETD